VATSQQCTRETRVGGTSNPPAAEGNFHVKSWNALKPQIVENYSIHMSYVDKRDRMPRSYSISDRTSSEQRGFSNQYAIWDKMTHFEFREHLVHDLVLAVEDKGVNIDRGYSIIPVVPSGDKAHETLTSQG
jgi:hypothetical protein